MEKGIDKSAQRALEAYPVEMYEEVGWRCVDKNTYKRQYFIEGYHQAEKDLELSWEDISIIRQIMFDYNRKIRNGIRNGMAIPNDEEYCKEVLKRFKERKENGTGEG